SGTPLIRVTSFVAQCRHRIYAQSAARRNVTREQSDRGEHTGDSGERGGIAWADGEKQILQIACESERSQYPDRQSAGGDARTLEKDDLQNIGTAPAQRDTNSDFLSTLRHRIRDHAVDTDAGEDEREAAEKAEK